MAEIATEKRRLFILQHLREVPGYECSAELLLAACRARGVPSSQAQMAAALAFLEGLELITTRQGGGFVIARVTDTGVEVSNGITGMPGIARPGPGA